jgi:hypothetical protein
MDSPRPGSARGLFSLLAAKIQGCRAQQSALIAQKFVANVFQNVDGALHAYFARQDQIFILDAQDAFVAYTFFMRLLDTRSNGVSTRESALLYDDLWPRQAGKSFFY